MAGVQENDLVDVLYLVGAAVLRGKRCLYWLFSWFVWCQVRATVSVPTDLLKIMTTIVSEMLPAVASAVMPPPSFSMRYSDKVAKTAVGRTAEHARIRVELSTRRSLRFLKKEFHLINLALEFMRRARHDARYVPRALATHRALVAMEKKTADWYAKFAAALSTIEHTPPNFEKVPAMVDVLTQRGARVLNLIVSIDAICVQMLTLEFRKVLSNADRQMVIEQLFDGLLEIKASAMGERDAQPAAAADALTDAPSPPTGAAEPSA